LFRQRVWKIINLLKNHYKICKIYRIIDAIDFSFKPLMVATFVMFVYDSVVINILILENVSIYKKTYKNWPRNSKKTIFRYTDKQKSLKINKNHQTQTNKRNNSIHLSLKLTKIVKRHKLSPILSILRKTSYRLYKYLHTW
jgi:hypothetical protein